jgi:peptidoglycan-associated lipoprotein
VTGAGGSRTQPRTGAAGGGRNTPPVETVDTGPEVVSPIEGGGVSGSDVDGGSPEGGPLADIHFEFNKATLSEQARATLEKHALWLQNHRDTRVTIEGHCDERGTVEYNLALGEQRARAAYDYLLSLGIAGDRLKTVSYGKERPVETGNSEEAWSKNRRAHFAVAGSPST